MSSQVHLQLESGEGSREGGREGKRALGDGSGFRTSEERPRSRLISMDPAARLSGAQKAWTTKLTS
jgi:hypothetical protein